MVSATCLCTHDSPNTPDTVNRHPPAAPVISYAVAGDAGVTVHWDTEPGATSYNLYYEAGSAVDTISGTKLAGVTSPWLVPGLTNGSPYAFAVSAVNDKGESGLGNPVVATPGVAPAITAQPKSDTITAGESATFSVTATGSAPLSYQWYKGDVAITGATSSGFVLSGVRPADSGTYTVIVSNAIVPNATSGAAVLTVDVPPEITSQPKSDTVTAGGSLLFSVTATGTRPLSYQWYKDSTAISGATSSSFSISYAQGSDSGTYTVVVSNGIAPSATSKAAVLTVKPAPGAPVITVQPQSQTVTAGGSATFTVAATGTAPLSYQWQQNGAAIPGATASSYSVSNAAASAIGAYTVVVTNAGGLGSIMSNSAILTVNIPPTIALQPASQIVIVGQRATFNVMASGTTPFSYQWGKDGAVIPGATASSLIVNAFALADSGNYSVTVMNGMGSVTSNPAQLTVVDTALLDIDGNVYHTIIMGTQVWMVENLKTTKYNDGVALPLVTDDTAWAALTTPGYSWYGNDSGSCKSAYGALYNWYAVNTGKLAPAGWHVPTDADWSALTTFLGGATVAGGKLKEGGTMHWQWPNMGAANDSGFLALPGGYRYVDGSFPFMGSYGYWWSATTCDATSAWARYLSCLSATISRYNFTLGYGFSVRCIRNP
jgi:uncharacterized protein (TIGR02145 family)